MGYLAASRHHQASTDESLSLMHILGRQVAKRLTPIVSRRRTATGWRDHGWISTGGRDYVSSRALGLTGIIAYRRESGNCRSLRSIGYCCAGFAGTEAGLLSG
jgi:hypothetical protein